MGFERGAIDRAYVLTKKFQPSMSFPGKGIELLRRAVEARGGGDSAGRSSAPIDAPFVEDVFA